MTKTTSRRPPLTSVRAASISVRWLRHGAIRPGMSTTRSPWTRHALRSAATRSGRTVSASNQAVSTIGGITTIRSGATLCSRVRRWAAYSECTCTSRPRTIASERMPSDAFAAGSPRYVVMTGTGVCFDAATACRAASAPCACTSSTRSVLRISSSRRTLRCRPNRFAEENPNSIHSPPIACSSPTRGPSAPATNARAPERSSASARLSVARPIRSSLSVGTASRIVAPASERGATRDVWPSSITNAVHPQSGR